MITSIRLNQLVGSKINKVASGATPNINRRTLPTAVYQTSVYGTSDNDVLSKDGGRQVDKAKMKIVKAIIKKLLILIMLAGMPASWIIFDNILNQTKAASATAIVASELKHQKDIIRLKAKHKKEIAQLKLKNKKNIAKAKMKERSKRLVASVPVVGTVLLLWAGKDEYEDYQEWLNDNPNGTADKYANFKTSLLVEP